MPQLLQWCTLEPQGASGLAAIRFAAPIRISSIRIFPKDAQPFKEVPDIVSKTHPEAFFLEIFFNAQELNPTPASESKDQQPPRPPNALVPTSIAYAGGTTDFYVDMGTEHATRLMIVKGEYDFVSLAIYGDVVAKPPPVRSYESSVLPAPDPLPLSPALSPAHAADPRALAEKLLSIVSDSVPLPLVVRLLFCLKATDEDWDNKDFPHLYADLENTEGDFNLEDVVNSVGRPIEDDVHSEAFATLANRVSDFVGPKDNDQAYFIAKLISIAAPQNPEMATTLLEHLDLAAIFDETVIDKYTMHYLLQSCANRDVAAHIRKSEPLLHLFESLQTSAKASASVQELARRLVARVHAWLAFEGCLEDPKGDFREAVQFLKDVTLDENSLGIWLSCMLLNADLYGPLLRDGEATAGESVGEVAPPPPLFRKGTMVGNREEFLTFVRALVGVVSVLATFAFADGLPYDMCRERTLAVISIWQTVEGYENIVNQILQLKQLTSRLVWIIGDCDPPRKSCIFAERILAKMGDEPEMNLQDSFADKILELKQPLAHIAETERLELQKNALVAKDGLLGAVEEILFKSDRPFSLRRLRTLRVSAAIIQRELSFDEREWPVLEQFWHDGAHGLVARLVDLVVELSEDLSKHFAISNTQRVVDQAHVAQLFSTASDLLRLVEGAATGYPLPRRALAALACAVVDVYVCCDAAEGAFSAQAGGHACVAAQLARQACLDVLRALAAPGVLAEAGVLGAQVVLGAVLGRATEVGEHEPVHRLMQVFSLVDHLIPYPGGGGEGGDASYWVVDVIPRVLGELKGFVQVLDLESRLHMFRRLVRLDEGVTGIGEWLLMEEVKGGLEVLKELGRASLSVTYRLVLQHQLLDTLDLLLELVKPESTLLAWYSDALASNHELSECHKALLRSIMEGRYSSSSLTRLVQNLSKKADVMEPDLRFTLLLLILRSVQTDPTLPGLLDAFMPILRTLPLESFDIHSFRVELGLALASYSQHPSSLDAETGAALLDVLEWTVHYQTDVARTTCYLQGLKAEQYDTVCATLSRLLPPSQSQNIPAVQSKISIDEDEVFAPPSTELPSEHPRLSLSDLESLLCPPKEGERPSTPRGTKTPEILGTIISPPTALLRSPAATGLTKTYVNDDFRQLRQAPAARMNTSRLPSMHGALGVSFDVVGSFANGFLLCCDAPLYSIPRWPSLETAVDDYETAARSSSSPTLLPAADIVMGPPVPTGFMLMGPTAMMQQQPGSPTMAFGGGSLNLSGL